MVTMVSCGNEELLAQSSKWHPQASRDKPGVRTVGAAHTFEGSCHINLVQAKAVPIPEPVTAMLPVLA